MGSPLPGGVAGGRARPHPTGMACCTSTAPTPRWPISGGRPRRSCPVYGVELPHHNEGHGSGVKLPTAAHYDDATLHPRAWRATRRPGPALSGWRSSLNATEAPQWLQAAGAAAARDFSLVTPSSVPRRLLFLLCKVGAGLLGCARSTPTTGPTRQDGASAARSVSAFAGSPVAATSSTAQSRFRRAGLEQGLTAATARPTKARTRSAPREARGGDRKCGLRVEAECLVAHSGEPVYERCLLQRAAHPVHQLSSGGRRPSRGERCELAMQAGTQCDRSVADISRESCSSNGIRSTTPSCLCFDCWTGSTCSTRWATSLVQAGRAPILRGLQLCLPRGGATIRALVPPELHALPDQRRDGRRRDPRTPRLEKAVRELPPWRQLSCRRAATAAPLPRRARVLAHGVARPRRSTPRPPPRLPSPAPVTAAPSATAPLCGSQRMHLSSASARPSQRRIYALSLHALATQPCTCDAPPCNCAPAPAPEAWARRCGGSALYSGYVEPGSYFQTRLFHWHDAPVATAEMPVLEMVPAQQSRRRSWLKTPSAC